MKLDYVIRIDRGTCLTEPDGRRWKLGQEELMPGQVRWVPGVRYGLQHGRPREWCLKRRPVLAGPQAATAPAPVGRPD